jgi:hypothetical protein
MRAGGDRSALKLSDAEKKPAVKVARNALSERVSGQSPEM